MKTSHKRWWLWIPLLGVGVWLALFGDRTPADDIAAPIAAPAPSAHPVETGNNAAALVALVQRESLVPKAEATVDARASRDLFSSRNWDPPPLPPPPAAPAPPPVAPPQPYTFVGKKQEGSVWEVYLTRDDMTFVARQGQILEGSWRVDWIEPPTLTLTYLPLEQAETLAIGETR